MDFLSGFKKELASMDGVLTSSDPPRYWYSTGNVVLNHIISGNFKNGIPQGRITDFAGPSGSGKSFNVGNAAAAAQKAGAHVLIIDSENALDDTFMTNLGVDVDNNYTYVSVTTIAQVIGVVSAFLKGYRKEYGNDLLNAPHVFVAIDSLDMLMTETELDHYTKGDQKGDQGQRNKQLKAMLRSFVQDIKPLNVMMVVTSQVYKNQDVTNGEGVWIVSDAVKYACSQIVLVTKLKLKLDKSTSVVDGIRMKCEGYKTRFTKPFQTVTIEVPYESGIDMYSGLIETATALGIIEKAGSRYKLKGSDKTFYSKEVAQYAEYIISTAEAMENRFLSTDVSDDELDLVPDTKKDTASRRLEKVKQSND